MTGSDAFKKTIQSYLELRAGFDNLFAVKYKNENKNIDDCITYILNRIQKSGIAGYTDDEVFGMAIHYYQEDNLEIGNPINNAQIVVNHVVELTQEEIEEARKEAIQKVHEDTYKKATSPVKKVTKKEVVQSLSLFGEDE